ncbi:MAG: hypothetical protein OXH86_09790 [Acidimicrobiaceae bacterium]|nr:hypothetical protein [Acidimicrobiaceae bacterium]
MPSLRALLKPADPSLLVVLPLAGLALQSAERLGVYLNAAATGTNPFRAARHTWRLVGTHLDQGTFAPLGRFAEYLTHGVALEADESLSLAPHAVLGAVRLALVAVTAVLAAALAVARDRDLTVRKPTWPELASMA